MKRYLLLIATVLGCTTAQAAPPIVLRELPTAQAVQGAADDLDAIYAIEDHSIARFDRKSGRRLALWEGDPSIYIHINACERVDHRLACAMSNYPGVPMSSSLEWFDATSLRHLGTHSFGPGWGSLTWIDWQRGSWWACFANYDGSGGSPPADHRATVLVRLDTRFIPQESWLFPEDVLNAFGRDSASGGRWGRDGLLYVTGHDRPELYVLSLPVAGGRLRHVSTRVIAFHGQAFDWDVINQRAIWGIDRQRHMLIESLIGDDFH